MKIVKENIFEEFLNTFDSEENELYDEWKFAIAEKIAVILYSMVDMEDHPEDEFLYDFFTSEKYNLDPFDKYDNELYKMFLMKDDVESASYRMLDLIKKEYKK